MSKKTVTLKFFYIFFPTLFFGTELSAQNYDYLGTGLPVCYITTKDGAVISSKEHYLSASIKILHNEIQLLPDTEIKIRVRGNATSNYPKKPYKIKFDRKISPLPGMNKDKSFVLLANYTDRSLMNTAIGFKIGTMLDNGWVPDSEFIELVINGEYLGNYQLAEDVRRGKTRVDIDTSGFLIEFDFDYKSSLNYFSTDYNNWFFTFKYPDDDEMIESNFNDAKNFMNRFEAALYSNDFAVSRVYANLIDEESFAKWYYHKNLLQMDECNRYYLKNDDSEDTKLKMGPLWDFEWCLANADNRMSPTHYLENKLYFNQICEDDVFMGQVALVHAQYGEKIYSEIISYYDILSDSLRKSQAENFKRWDILDKPIALATHPLGSWEKEVEYSKKFFIAHYKWLDSLLSEYLDNTSVSSPGVDVMPGDIDISDGIYNIMGQKIDGVPTTPGIYIVNGKKYTLSSLLEQIDNHSFQ